MNKAIQVLKNRLDGIKRNIVDNNSRIEDYEHNILLEKNEIEKYIEELESINKSIKILECIDNE